MGFFILSHPILIPFPETVAVNEVDEIHEELLDKCTSNNPKNPNNNSTLPGRVLPVLIEKIPRGNPSTPLGRRKKNSKRINYHEANESKSDVMEYWVYGTLLVTCLIILVLW